MAPSEQEERASNSSARAMANINHVPERTAEERQDESQYPTGLNRILIMVSLMLGTTIMSLDTTIVSIAIPKISTQFHALDDVGWYGAAYLMTLTAITPVAANFYKYFDPKAVYLISIVIFEGLLQGAFGILTYVCPLEKRPIFLAVVVSLFGLFSSIGPVIGGSLTESVTWRWCFWINLPIGGLVFALVVFFLNLRGVDQSTRSLPLPTKLKKLDLPGVVLLLAAVCCLFLALQEGSAMVPWSSSKPIGLFVGFGMLLAVFGVWQWKAGDNATMPLHYFKDRTVVWGSLYLLWDDMASYVASTEAYLPRALGVPIGNALLIDGLRSQVPKYAPGISPDAVIRNEALDLQSLTTSPGLLRGLRKAYAIAISHVTIFLVVLICISVPTACGMKWLNIKEVSKRNEEEKKMMRDVEKSVQGAGLEQSPPESGVLKA
ncbi:MAG: hypothetical protein Q9191_004663 [Dirinaria sp. TL-2023a]